MRALYRQLLFEIDRFGVEPNSIDTLFIGGGTPSTISPKLYAPIFQLLDIYLKNGAEITTEANPNSATKKWLKGMRELGINRVSFGVQSFDAHKLKALNRAHTPQEAIDAIHIAKDIGIEHISLDLIYNYQGDTLELMNRDIEIAFSLPIDHISAYELTIESGTHFSSRPEVRQEYEELAFFVAKAIGSRGFDHYEISNFGSYRSRHNIGYWRLDDYMGVGAGAVGFFKDRRYYPQKDIDSYISNPLDIDEEIIASDDMLTEKIFLGLRSYIGIQMSLLSDEMRRRADYLVQKSKLTLNGTRYQNPNLFLADEIALYLLSD